MAQRKSLDYNAGEHRRLARRNPGACTPLPSAHRNGNVQTGAPKVGSQISGHRTVAVRIYAVAGESGRRVKVAANYVGMGADWPDAGERFL